jgi:hypothetical protein
MVVFEEMRFGDRDKKNDAAVRLILISKYSRAVRPRQGTAAEFLAFLVLRPRNVPD